MKKIMAGICAERGNVKTTDETIEWGYFSTRETTVDVSALLLLAEENGIDVAKEELVRGNINKIKKLARQYEDFENVISIGRGKQKFCMKKLNGEESEDD